MRMPKGSLTILHIVISIGETSAPYNEHCLPMAAKHDISICTYFRSDFKPAEAITFFEGDSSLFGFFRNIKSALREKDYDVIHAHSPHVGLLFLLATLFSFWRYASSTVITVHDSYQNFKLRNRLMFIPVFATFRKVVCCSRASFASFPAFYKWLAGDRLSAVQNGLDIDRVDSVAANIRRQTRDKGDFAIVAISRLVEVKNPFTILTAFRKDADQSSRLVYIGDGPLRSSLIAQSRQAGTDGRIAFTGLIPRVSVFEQLLSADLFISTSRGEGLPVSVLEAMSCRCPVLLSDIPPHREIAEDVDFIPLVDQDDAVGFAREIQRYREMPASQRSAIGQQGRKLVEERFSLSAMHAGYAAVYAQITGHRSPTLADSVTSVNTR